MKDTEAFCGLWSLKNPEVLFKEDYTTESGGNYGEILLQPYSMVRYLPDLFVPFLSAEMGSIR